MVTGNPRLNVEGGEVDGSLLVLLFFGGKTVLEESLAVSLVVLYIPKGMTNTNNHLTISKKR